MEIMTLIYLLVFIVFALVATAVLQIRMAGIKVKDFWSFIQANQMLDQLYKFSKRYKIMSPQEQIIFLSEAEKVFAGVKNPMAKLNYVITKTQIDAVKNNITIDDVNNFAISKDVHLEENELIFTYEFIKKNWESILENPQLFNIDRYKNNFKEETFSKVKKLYNEYFQQYSRYL